METVQLGIVGAEGRRGRQLHELFTQEAGVEVTALVDVSYKDAYEVGETAAGRFSDIGDILGSNEIGAVVIATPDRFHEEHAIAALNSGKNVYLEKPMAITPEACDRIINAAEANQRLVYVGHNMRHFTVIKKMKQLIDEGAVGDIKAVWEQHLISYGRRHYFSEDRWHRKRENIGGLLIHKASHDLDIIQWFAGGQAKRVVAMGYLAVWGDQPGEPDVEDVSTVAMELDNGVQASYSQCHFGFDTCREFTVLGTKGTLRNRGDNPEIAVVQLYNKRRRSIQPEPTQEWRFQAEKGFHGDSDQRIINEFIGVLRGELKPTISPQEAAWAVKVGYAATQSLRSDSKVISVR